MVSERFQYIRAGEWGMMGQIPGGGPYKLTHMAMDQWSPSTRRVNLLRVLQLGDKHPLHEFTVDIFTI